MVFVDPPYSMECCRDAAVRLAESGILASGAIVVLESGTEEFDPAEIAGFEVMKSTRYGKKTTLNVLLYRGV